MRIKENIFISDNLIEGMKVGNVLFICVLFKGKL